MERISTSKNYKQNVKMSQKIITDITDIKVAVGKIEQHLTSMNGKLVRHSDFIYDKCPALRREVYNKMDKFMWINISGWTGIIIAVILSKLLM
jgi:hypothetical protein